MTLTALLTALAGCGVARTTTGSTPATPTAGATTTASTSPATTEPPCHYRTFRDGAIAPPAACAPGVVDAGAAGRPQQTICRPGYAHGVRSSEQYTERIKLALLDRYAASEPSASYVVDYLVAIEDGGSPTDPRNMWPQPIAQAKQKDAIEDYLHREICTGKVSVQQAAHILEGDWLAADTEHH